MRLHMTKLPCNYGIKKDSCPLCGLEENVETEHFFSCCLMTKRIAEIWGVTSQDLNGPVENLKNAKNHLKKVEIMMEQHMNNIKKHNI